MPPHGGIAGWRNHGVESPDATMGTKGGDGNAGGGAHGADGEPMERSDAEDLGGRDGPVSTTPRDPEG